MLTEMQLKDVIEPFKSASYGDALAMCRRYIPEAEYYVNPDGVVDVSGDMFPASLSSFVVNQKLAVQFGKLTGSMETLKLAGSVRSLEGLPKKLPNRILDVRSDFLKDLTGAPEEVDSFYVNSHSLTSLRGAPKRVNNTFSVVAPTLTSFEGFPTTMVGALDFRLCKRVKTTDGLKNLDLGSIELPLGIEQITDIPKTCVSISVFPCVGIAHLLRIPDIEHVHIIEPRKGQVAIMLRGIFDECLALSSTPRARWLHAERLMIDHDLEYLL